MEEPQAVCTAAGAKFKQNNIRAACTSTYLKQGYKHYYSDG